jgi:hypothetical protein
VNALKLVAGKRVKPSTWVFRATKRPAPDWHDVTACGTNEPFTLKLKLWVNPEPEKKP